MSKKNLSRSVLEGGRRNYNKFERYESHTIERAINREFCGRAKIDDEFFDEHVIEKRPKVYKGFTDKLGPMYRWLRAHVGQPWNDVRAEACKMYDTRTIAGRHILYDHLFSSVDESGSQLPYWRSYEFVVDDDGILQNNPNGYRAQRIKRRQEERAKGWVRVGYDRLQSWANNRKVIDYGTAQYWTAVPTRSSWSVCGHSSCPYENKQVVIQVPKVTTWNGHVRAAYKRVEKHCFSPVYAGLAQGEKFTNEEAEFWRKLHPNDRESLTYSKDK